MTGSNSQQAPLTDFSQYAGSPSLRAYCYAELAVSSPAVAETTAITHCTYPGRDDQAEWACVACINTDI